jgi:hypothetical protein
MVQYSDSGEADLDWIVDITLPGTNRPVYLYTRRLIGDRLGIFSAPNNLRPTRFSGIGSRIRCQRMPVFGSLTGVRFEAVKSTISEFVTDRMLGPLSILEYHFVICGSLALIRTVQRTGA